MPLKNDPYLTFIIPAYNEYSNLVHAVKTNRETGARLNRSFEIVAVDDGSADDSGMLLERLSNEITELKVFAHPRNLGYGATVRTGIECASGEFVIVAPADSPLTFETLCHFLSVADNADIVLGCRDEKPNYNWIMRFNSKLYHSVLRIVCGLPYRDVNWIHLYRRSIFDCINISFDRIVMTAEVVLKAQACRMRVVEVSCPMLPRIHGRPSAGRPRVIFQTGMDLLLLLFQWKSGKVERDLEQFLRR